MKFGTVYKQGDIVVVPFPFTNLSAIKQRPVLVLSKNSDIEKYDDVITCGLTSNLKDSAHSVLINNNNLVEGEIPVKSRVKVDKLFTLDKEIIKKKVARLDKESFDKVRKAFVSLV